jgi:hypothetical protein
VPGETTRRHFAEPDPVGWKDPGPTLQPRVMSRAASVVTIDPDVPWDMVDWHLMTTDA